MRRGYTSTVLAAIQWLGFMFANTVVIPLSVGAAFHLSTVALSGAMARSFIITGLACLIQGWIGHKMPLMEGQSGLWWGVLLNLAATGSAAGVSLTKIGGSIGVGMVLGGLALMISGALGLHRVLNRLFTPIVMAVLLILLSAQLIDIFFQGMVGLDQGHVIEPKVAILSIVLVLVVSFLTIGVRGWISNFSILIGLALGWIVYVLWVGNQAPVALPEWSEITRLWAWGQPSYSAGILIACVVTALINTTNTIATLRASEPLFNQPVSDNTYRKSLLLSGFFTVISGPLSLVAYAPYTSSIGFLRTTRILSRAPFMLGAGLFVVLGSIPHLSAWFATLPVSVGDSVLFVAYLQLFGSALQNIKGMEFDFRSIFRLALPVLTGLAVLATPHQAFSTLPPILQSILGNGMLDGILLATIMEAVVPWERLRA